MTPMGEPYALTIVPLTYALLPHFTPVTGFHLHLLYSEVLAEIYWQSSSRSSVIVAKTRPQLQDEWATSTKSVGTTGTMVLRRRVPMR